MKYFAQVHFVIEAENWDDAEKIQQDAGASLMGRVGIVDYQTDEPVEADDYGNAG